MSRPIEEEAEAATAAACEFFVLASSSSSGTRSPFIPAARSGRALLLSLQLIPPRPPRFNDPIAWPWKDASAAFGEG
jgi:hypothetical protein